MCRTIDFYGLRLGRNQTTAIQRDGDGRWEGSGSLMDCYGEGTLTVNSYYSTTLLAQLL